MSIAILGNGHIEIETSAQIRVAGGNADVEHQVVMVDNVAWNMGLFLSIYEILIPRGSEKEMCFSLEMFVL